MLTLLENIFLGRRFVLDVSMLMASRKWHRAMLVCEAS